MSVLSKVVLNSYTFNLLCVVGSIKNTLDKHCFKCFCVSTGGDQRSQLCHCKHACTHTIIQCMHRYLLYEAHSVDLSVHSCIEDNHVLLSRCMQSLEAGS